VNLPIRWKLLGSYLFLLLVMGGGLFLYISWRLENHLIAGVRANLHSEAGLAALMVERELLDLQRDAPRLATELGRQLKARLTLIDTDGTVVGDSELSATDLGFLENHRDRPEVQQALQQGRGSAIRYSTTLRTRMLYVTQPLATSSGRQVVLRLALPLAMVDAAKHDLQANLGIAFALASLLAFGLSLALSQVSVRILGELTEGARRFGSGDFRARLPVASRDELGELARVMNDMAARLQEQMERLTRERNRLDAILYGIGEGLLVTDRSGRIMLVNRAFVEMFEVQGNPAGMPLIELTRAPALHDALRRVLQDEGETRCEIVLPGEEERTLLTHWVPLREEGTVTGVVAVFHDIGDLRRLERVRRDFVANVSHELRTPVTVIGGYAESLADGLIVSDPAAAARFATIIRTHAERMAALIGDLLTLSQLEVRGFKLDLAPIPLAATMRRCCELLEPKAAAKKIQIDCATGGDLLVLADPQRLEQVLVNLLDNAIKYTPEGGKVELTAQAKNDAVEILVRDTGRGIPPLALSRIFERFYRVDSGRSRAEGGTGLGLAIVKHIVQLHGGSIAVASQPGEGTTFTVTLRRRENSG
jgi:two-component system phosphate regulon sensor histidine kinase PhoR